MLELNVNTKSPAAITAAFKKIKEMVTSGAVSKNTPVHLVLEAGSYRESIRYNLSNPLIMESAPGTKAEDCVVQAENCESFNKGVENRSIFALGPNVSRITIRNFTVINTHMKSVEGNATAADSAEAFLWNNTNGLLVAEGMRFESRQNTVCLKGCSRFTNCYFTGDVDFIYGDVDTALFENCVIHIREDNRGDYNGYAVKSMAYANKMGFVFKDCTFTADKRKKSRSYIYRTTGQGSALSPKNWDNAAIINCKISDMIDEELVWDDDMNLNVYPRGNAKVGLREYNTQIMDKNGNLTPADTGRHNIKSYLLTNQDYNNGYATRYQILHDTLFASEM